MRLDFGARSIFLVKKSALTLVFYKFTFTKFYKSVKQICYITDFHKGTLMKNIATKLSLVSLSVLLMSGCTFSSDALLPSLTDSGAQVSAGADSGTAEMVPVLGTTDFKPIEISEGDNTGTFVGQKVISFRNELTQLQESIRLYNEELQKIRSSVINNALQYHKAIGGIEAKLQVGTTPGNPHMYAMLQQAQTNIQTMNANTDALNQLSAKVSSDAAMTGYLLDSIRAAYGVSGAVDEDHRQLRILENETNQTSILINSLLSEVNSDVSRQSQYVESARNYIVDLNDAIKVGSYGVSNAPLSNTTVNTGTTSGPLLINSPQTAVLNNSKPLFVAKFNKSNVNYHDGLRRAVSNAVARKPSVRFDVVAISPTSGSQLAKNNVQKNATEIFQEMINLGVGADKISLSSKSSSDATSSEVRIYVK